MPRMINKKILNNENVELLMTLDKNNVRCDGHDDDDDFDYDDDNHDIS